jgi:hypothetical protein
MYDKQGLVWRIETTLHNPRRFRVWRAAEGGDQRQRNLRKGVADSWRLVQVALASNGRYLGGLSVVERATPSHQVLRNNAEQVIEREPLTRGTDENRPYRG